jgi:hypothetical protein
MRGEMQRQAPVPVCRCGNDGTPALSPVRSFRHSPLPSQRIPATPRARHAAGSQAKALPGNGRSPAAAQTRGGRCARQLRRDTPPGRRQLLPRVRWEGTGAAAMENSCSPPAHLPVNPSRAAAHAHTWQHARRWALRRPRRPPLTWRLLCANSSRLPLLPPLQLPGPVAGLREPLRPQGDPRLRAQRGGAVRRGANGRRPAGAATLHAHRMRGYRRGRRGMHLLPWHAVLGC